ARTHRPLRFAFSVAVAVLPLDTPGTATETDDLPPPISARPLRLGKRIRPHASSPTWLSEVTDAKIAVLAGGSGADDPVPTCTCSPFRLLSETMNAPVGPSIQAPRLPMAMSPTDPPASPNPWTPIPVPACPMTPRPVVDSPSTPTPSPVVEALNASTSAVPWVMDVSAVAGLALLV